MAKKISIRLSTESIDEAIKSLKWYKQEIQYRTELFIARLADVGIQTIEANKYSEGDSDFNGLVSEVRFDQNGDTVRATLVLKGEDVAFVEFGAGVHYNGSVGQSPNPFGQGLGYTIGSYGLGLGANDFWHYKDDDGWHTSHGTKAAMPVAKADDEIRKQFVSIAREVFES